MLSVGTQKAKHSSLLPGLGCHIDNIVVVDILRGGDLPIVVGIHTIRIVDFSELWRPKARLATNISPLRSIPSGLATSESPESSCAVSRRSGSVLLPAVRWSTLIALTGIGNPEVFESNPARLRTAAVHRDPRRRCFVGLFEGLAIWACSTGVAVGLVPQVD